MTERTCVSPLATRPVLYTDTIKGGQQALRDDLWAVTTDELNVLEVQRAQLAAALAATEQDAARYRWLRDQARAGYEEQLFVTPDGHKDYYAPNGIYGDGLDEAVDEAMNRPAAG